MPNERAWRPLRRIFGQQPADVDAEIEYHIEMRTEELIAAGRDPDEARREAIRAFGDVNRVRDDVWRLDASHNRDLLRASRLASLWQDIRYGARSFRRSPAFVAVAVLSISLGIAANTTVFTMVNSVLLRTPGGLQADGLVRVYQNHHSPLSYRDLTWFREQSSGFAHLVAEEPMPVGIRIGEEPERARAAVVTESFFSTLGVPMALGQPLAGEETRAAGTNSAVVLSHRYWMQRMAGDSAVIDRTMLINGHPFTIVGIANEEFASSVAGWRTDFWIPIGELFTIRGERLSDINWSLYVTARLAPGMDRADAQQLMNALMQRLAVEQPEGHERMSITLDHMRGLNAEVRLPLEIASALLLAVVFVVLLIACANVANLLLSRGAARRGEIGVRMAIGAGRGRIVRQLLIESLLLAMLGGALGLAGAYGAVSLIARAMPSELDGALRVQPDVNVLIFTGALIVLTAVMFGLLPALRASRLSLTDAIHSDGGRGGTRNVRLGRTLVGVQVAGAMLLLSTAVLFLRGMRAAAGLNPGFDPAGVLDVPVDLSLHPRDAEGQLAFYHELSERAKGIPGVRDVALAALVPLSGSNMQMLLELSGETRDPAQGGGGRQTYFNVVGPGYFSTMGIPIVRGREFNSGDTRSAPLAVIVNQHTAATLWPDADPIGQRIHFTGDSAREFSVVGVARDTKYNMPGESTPTFIYLALAQQPREEMTLQVRTTGDMAGVVRALRTLPSDIDPALPPAEVSTMDQDMSVVLLPARGGATLLGAFGAVAMLLAASGIFGVTSYAVAQRTREMGIRGALGATSRELQRLVIGDAMRVVLIGLVAGVALAIPAGLALRGLLYGVSPLHPVTLAGMPLLLAGVALLASWLPARRAARVSPLIAMHAE